MADDNVVDLRAWRRSLPPRRKSGEPARALVERVHESFRVLVEEDTEGAIGHLLSYILRIHEVENKRSPVSRRAMPPESITPLLDSVGEHYPDLSPALRHGFLCQRLCYLGDLFAGYAAEYMVRLAHGHLVRDLVVNNPGFRPALRKQKEFLYTCPNATTFGRHREHPTVATRWMAVAVVTNGAHATLPVRRKYREMHPGLLDEALLIIAAEVHTQALRRSGEEGGTLDEHIETLLGGYDPSLHERILEHMAKRDWILLAD